MSIVQPGGVQIFPYRGRKYFANAVNFDGTNDYLTRGADLTGIADGKAGTISLWVKHGSAAGAQRYLNQVSGTDRFSLILTGGGPQLVGANTTGTNILVITNSTTTIGTTIWYHYLASWDLAAGAGKLFINDVDETVATTLTNDTIDYTSTNWGIGATTAGASKANADMAELWFTTTFLDLTIAANRRKFITAAGKPADLKFDGSGPTGSVPIVYMRGSLAQWPTNAGSGGGWTVTGTLTASASTPSD